MIKQTDLRKQELIRKIDKITDRINELLGEKTTLIFKFEHGEIHPMLAYLKEQTINFEAELLNEQVEQIKAEFEFIDMLSNCGLDLPQEDF